MADGVFQAQPQLDLTPAIDGQTTFAGSEVGDVRDFLAIVWPGYDLTQNYSSHICNASFGAL
jgi:hypothetical protein